MKTITSVELAKLAGVSQSTVSRCLNDSPLVSDETKARIKKLAEEYSFQFNTSARGLKTNRTGVIGYVFSEDFTGFANHYIQSDIYYRIRMQLMKDNLDLVPIFDDRRSGRSSTIEENISNRKFDALIFNRPQVDERIKNLLDETKIPFIFIYDTNEDSEIPFMIAPSHFQIGELVANAFCDAGYSNFVEITGPQHRIDVVHKHCGFEETLKKHGFNLPKGNILTANYSLEKARDQAIKNVKIFKSGTACFVHNDLMAIGVIDGLKRQGISIPEDVALIGSDNIPMGQWFAPYLTTVAVDYDKIIDLTVKWVLDMAKGILPESYRYVLSSKLVIRETFKE